MKITVKFFSLFLVLLLLSAMSVTLYAEESNVTATAIANNSPIYTIVVPQKFRQMTCNAQKPPIITKRISASAFPKICFCKASKLAYAFTVTTVYLHSKTPMEVQYFPTKYFPMQTLKIPCKTVTFLQPSARQARRAALFALIKRTL